MGARIKRGDTVTVIAGEDVGKSGKVLEHKGDRVIIEGLNVRKKTMRRSPSQPQGGIVDKECPVHISNVMPQEEYERRRAKRGAAEQNVQEQEGQE